MVKTRAFLSLLLTAALAAPALAAEPPPGLYQAIFRGDAAAVSATLAEGADLEAVNAHGHTPLIWAAQHGKAEIVRLLLSRGAAVDAADANGYTALIWAAQEGYIKVAEVLLAAGADHRAVEKHGYTALMWASQQGYTGVVRVLLAAGADPAFTSAGGSAIELARRFGREDVLRLFGALKPHKPIRWKVLGHSVEGKPIRLAEAGAGPRTVLFIGGLHGDEPQGATVIAKLLAEIEAEPAIVAGHRLLAVPVANPDGAARATRQNARGVDLNRNFPTRWRKSRPGRYFGGHQPLSEPETQALQGLIRAERPALIVSFHAPLGCTNYDGVAALPLARAMSERNGYRLLADIGYATPGSLGQHAAHGHGIPIITLEFGQEPAHTLYPRVRDSLLLAFGR